MSNSVSSSPVVRRRRRAEVSALVKNFQQSGQRLSDFCQQHQIAPSTITRHMHRLQSSVASTSASPASSPSPSPSPHPAPPQLLPVELVEDVQGRHPRRPASHTSPLVLELSGGHRVVLQHDFDESTLLRLIAVLGKA